MCFLLLSELDEVLDKLNQGPSVSQQQQRVPDTTDTSGEDTDVDQPRRRVRSRRTFKMKNGYAVGELPQFSVTGPTDAANKLSEFYCRVCRKGVSVLTHGGYEIIRHFQGHRHFARDQRLRFEMPGWRHWSSTATHSVKTSFRDNERRLCLPPCSPGPRIYFSGGPDSGCLRKCRSTAANVGKSLVPYRCASFGWELRTR